MSSEKDCSPAETKIFDWIEENIIIESFEQVGNPIQRFIPPCFEAYCKILHPFIIDLDAPETFFNEKEAQRTKESKLIKIIYDKLNFADPYLLNLDLKSFIQTATEITLEKHKMERVILDLPLKDTSNSELKKEMSTIFIETIKNVIRDFEDVLESEKMDQMFKINPILFKSFDKVVKKKKVKWEDLAHQYELHFHENISTESFRKKFNSLGYPINLYFPDSALDKAQCVQLVHVLNNFCKTKMVLIRSLSDRHELVNKICPIEKMMTNNEQDALKGGYIVDEHQEWIIYADYHRDLEMTILGGSKLLIEKLKEETDLEIVPCSPISRVDTYSDRFN